MKEINERVKNLLSLGDVEIGKESIEYCRVPYTLTEACIMGVNWRGMDKVRKLNQTCLKYHTLYEGITGKVFRVYKINGREYKEKLG